jgi:long-chain acyl-CoA synthetase
MELLRSYAEMKGISYTSETDLLADPRIIDLFQRQVDKYTAELAQYEKVKRVALLAQELTIESGALTPTLKARRSVIESRFADVINRLYEEEARKVLAV